MTGSYILCLMIIICNAVPSAVPSSVNVSVLSANAITVHWDSIDCIELNGELIGYSVQHWEVGSVNLITIVIPGGGTTESIVSYLEPSTHYSVKVAAVNTAGTGVYHNVGRRYIGMARMPASRNTFSKPPNSQTKKL